MNLRGPETDFGLGAFSFRQTFFPVDRAAGMKVIDDKLLSIDVWLNAVCFCVMAE
jgi:hypothetical protein